jgi:hypothetical protein
LLNPLCKGLINICFHNLPALGCLTYVGLREDEF